MKDAQPTMAYAKLEAPPPLNHIQFYDGYVPALPADTYTIRLSYTLTPPSGSGAQSPSYTESKKFTIQGPEFTLDPSVISTIYPPQGSNNQYDRNLPFVVLNEPSLPWERSLVPDTEPQGTATPLPWMALLILTKDEVVIPGGTDGPVTTTTVSDLLEADSSGKTLKPALPRGWVSADLGKSPCQTITIPGAVFNKVMPTKEDLAYLAHCRAINTADEGGQLLSVILGNRLAVASHSPVRYYAHLVSLEGYADYLGPDGKAIPRQAGSSELMDVQLASLFNWNFVSKPEAGSNFRALVHGLIDSEKAGSGALSLLPIPESCKKVPKKGGAGTEAWARLEVHSRLSHGYAALAFNAGAGDQSFAWYRGPFSPVVPQALPRVGEGQTPVLQAPSADALMIYLSAQGVFDLSYAVAWNQGRGLALSDAGFTQDLIAYRKSAHSTAAKLAQRLSMIRPESQSLRQFAARDALTRHFSGQMAGGLGKRMSAAMNAGHAGAPVGEETMKPVKVSPREVLAMADAATVLADATSELRGAVASWLARLRRLSLLPFSCLVPDPCMLPVESIRFFHLDPTWLDALTAGALSVGIHGSADVAIQDRLLPDLMSAVQKEEERLYHRVYSAGAASAGKVSGLLIRSQLISAWPKLVVYAESGGVLVNVIRDDRLAPNVRLYLFDGIPDSVTLAEPYHGLQFGIEDDGIALRDVTTAGRIGAQLKGSPVKPKYRDASGGIMDVAGTAQRLAKALTASTIGSGDFALQMVKAPEMQHFGCKA